VGVGGGLVESWFAILVVRYAFTIDLGVIDSLEEGKARRRAWGRLTLLRLLARCEGGACSMEARDLG